MVRPPSNIINVSVREVLLNERNLLDRCKELIPIHVGREVDSMQTCVANEDDGCIWMANANVKFSLASALSQCRQEKVMLLLIVWSGQKLCCWWIHKAKSPCFKGVLSFVPDIVVKRVPRLIQEQA
ncbi:hypothetical protein LguiB_035578 [Lonicera macranthoides]